MTMARYVVEWGSRPTSGKVIRDTLKPGEYVIIGQSRPHTADHRMRLLRSAYEGWLEWGTLGGRDFNRRTSFGL